MSSSGSRRSCGRVERSLENRARDGLERIDEDHAHPQPRAGSPAFAAFAYSRAWYDTRTAHIVEIETDQGVIGWGECYGPVRMTAAVVESVAPWLIGEDPLRTDVIWRTVYPRLRDHGRKGVVIQGLSGIDIALWDIKGKHFGVPAHHLLGGAARSEVAAYATGLYRRKSGDPIRYLAEEAAGYEGFKAVKLKVGFGVEEDAEVDARGARGDRAQHCADGRCQSCL
jgi:L-alanine-DL-glutamate epimerase-like enolase superfamily enzyme